MRIVEGFLSFAAALTPKVVAGTFRLSILASSAADSFRLAGSDSPPVRLSNIGPSLRTTTRTLI